MSTTSMLAKDTTKNYSLVLINTRETYKILILKKPQPKETNTSIQNAINRAKQSIFQTNVSRIETSLKINKFNLR